jgi:uncharacterized protein (TIGR02246 family)
MTESLDDRVRRLEDLQAIHQLFIDYGEHLDAGDFEAFAQLFAEDGEVLLGPIGRVQGRGAIKDLMIAQLADSIGSTFHVVSSPRVALHGDTATSTVMWTVIGRAADGRPHVTMLGHHVDDLVRTTAGWRIRRRKGVIDIPSRLPGA